MATPLTDKLYEAKGAVQHVMDRYPEDAHGSAWLDEALELIGRSAEEIEAVEDPSEQIHREGENVITGQLEGGRGPVVGSFEG